MSYEQEITRLGAMIDEIRRMRNSCHPKHASNPRYHAYSMAVSALNRAIEDMRGEEALQ